LALRQFSIRVGCRGPTTETGFQQEMGPGCEGDEEEGGSRVVEEGLEHGNIVIEDGDKEPFGRFLDDVGCDKGREGYCGFWNDW
jgi:hypothetical protein